VAPAAQRSCWRQPIRSIAARARPPPGSGDRTSSCSAVHLSPTPDSASSAAPSDKEHSLLRAWNGRALAEGTTWLQLLPFDGMIAAVGPLFIPGDTACHECYLLRRAANLSSRPYRPEDAEQGVFPSSPALDAVLAGLAATAVLRWLALADGLIPGLVIAVEQVPEPAVSRHVLYRVPRCPACSHASGSVTLVPWHGSTGDGATGDAAPANGAIDVTA